MDYCMVWRPIYDLRWETMNVCTVYEIISENLTELSVKPANNSVNLAKFRVSELFLFLAWLNFISTEFCQIFENAMDSLVSELLYSARF
jgi:hypothetical protein